MHSEHPLALGAWSTIADPKYPCPKCHSFSMRNGPPNKPSLLFFQQHTLPPTRDSPCLQQCILLSCNPFLRDLHPQDFIESFVARHRWELN